VRVQTGDVVGCRNYRRIIISATMLDRLPGISASRVSDRRLNNRADCGRPGCVRRGGDGTCDDRARRAEHHCRGTSIARKVRVVCWVKGENRVFYHIRHAGSDVVAPGHDKVIPWSRNSFVPQDGAEKQDWRTGGEALWLAGPMARHYAKPIRLSRATIVSRQPLARRVSPPTAIHLRMQTSLSTLMRSTSQGIEASSVLAQTISAASSAFRPRYRWRCDVPAHRRRCAIVNWFGDRNQRRYRQGRTYRKQLRDRQPGWP